MHLDAPKKGRESFPDLNRVVGGSTSRSQQGSTQVLEVQLMFRLTGKDWPKSDLARTQSVVFPPLMIDFCCQFGYGNPNLVRYIAWYRGQFQEALGTLMVRPMRLRLAT